MTDRPLECSRCKKEIEIIYKEIEKGVTSCTHMCSDCPYFKQKLQGEQPSSQNLAESEKVGGFCCSKCETSYDSFLLDGTLGCSECYHVFADVITEKLKREGLIPEKMQTILEKNDKTYLHLGKSPNEDLSSLVSSQVTDLNEALSDALQRENYEQAAELRDQIKQLMENADEGC